jgi:hypothetical protein
MRSKRNRLGSGANCHIESKSLTRKKFSLLARGGFETLEVRSLLAVDGMGVSPWTNADNRYDVNDNGTVEPADLLKLIDNLNRVGARSLIASAQGSGSSNDGNQSQEGYLDVSGDGQVTPQDAMFVVLALNEGSPSARFQIDTVDLAGNLISNVPQNEAFMLKVTARDLIAAAQFHGVFSAYMNISYNGNLASVAKFQADRPPIVFDDAAQFSDAFNIPLRGE